MRYLIVSDVHGNRFGLEAVLHDARGAWDKVLCLGDVVGYGAHPNECCEMLREVGATVLLGNHDAAALGWIDTGNWNDVAHTAIAWTGERLTKESWSWLHTLEPQRDVTLPGQVSFQLTHGSLQEPFYEVYILTEVEACESFAMMKYPLCFFGHTHRAGSFRAPEAFGFDSPIDTMHLPHGGTIQMEPGYKYLVNPGSCGQPRDRNPQARYALFDTVTALIEIKAVDYDIEAARRAIYDAGLCSLLGDRLLEGR